MPDEKSGEPLLILHTIDAPYVPQNFPGMVLQNDVPYEELIDHLCRASFVISSSLHGVVFAHAYGVPAVPVDLGGRVKGNGWKFLDYESRFRPNAEKPLRFEPDALSSAIDGLSSRAYSPSPGAVKDLQKLLLESFPFHYSSLY